jgi:hypothetical protein
MSHLTCQQCQQPILGCGKKYCSLSCAARANNHYIPKRKRKHRYTCEQCNVVIKSRNKRFCSNSCCGANRKAQSQQLLLAGSKFSCKTAKRYLENNQTGCAICGVSNWQGMQLTLILDHIDGNPENNTLSNLRLVCPNCDSQLPTFKGRNKGRGRHSRRKRYAAGLSY